jgi:toxin ParE1/3/4
MKIVITRRAILDLDNLRKYLAPKSPAGLRNVISALQKTIEDIPKSLSRGRATPHDDVWEKVVPKYGYIIPYYVRGETVFILRIYSSRRKSLDYVNVVDLE